jgi:hypothetical protein
LAARAALISLDLTAFAALTMRYLQDTEIVIDAYLSCAKPRRTGIPSMVSGRAGKENWRLHEDNSQL